MAEKADHNKTTHKQLYSEVDKIFFIDGYKHARSYLEQGINSENLLAMSASLYQSMDELIDAFINRCRKDGKKVECRKGCYLCCCQAVLVLPFEILILFHHLKEKLSKREMCGIHKRAVEKDEITSKMKVQEFLHYKAPCPLLQDGICLAYESRPMACRTYISSRKDGCIEEYHNPKDMDIFPVLYEFTIRAGRMINEGVCAYLIEHKIPSPEWQIESSLKTVYEDDQAFDKWLAGENIFQKRNYTPEELAYLDNFGSKREQKSNLN